MRSKSEQVNGPRNRSLSLLPSFSREMCEKEGKRESERESNVARVRASERERKKEQDSVEDRERKERQASVREEKCKRESARVREYLHEEQKETGNRNSHSSGKRTRVSRTLAEHRLV